MKNKERKLTRIFTAIMAVLILLLSVPMSALASDSFAETENETGAEEIELQNDEIIVLKENEDLREANIKHYDLSNGISKAVMYSQAVHYLDENGKWVDIDNSLTLSGNEYSTNNKSAIKFANKSGSNGLLSIKDGDYKIDLTPLDTNKVSVEIENPQENNSRKFDDVKKLSNLVSKATYKNIYDGIDLEYILTGNNVKENIIVNSKQESYIYTFELKLNKLNAELVDNSIALYDSDTGEKMYVIPAPYMYDSEGELSQEVEYTLTKNNKWKYTLTVEASKEWINSEERSFPVTIDPTIVADTDVIDNFFTVDNDANANLQYLMIGNFMNYYIDMLAFIKFDNIEATIPVDCMVVNAKTSLFVSYVDNSSNIDFRIGVYEATADWTNSILWKNRNNYYDSNSIISSTSITTTGVYEWDITSLYDKWQTQNYGFCLKAINLPGNVMARVHITTSEAVDSPIPQLELTYVSHIGVEDYYGYAYNTLGSYGESYVNLYNGSLTYINHLTTISNGNLSYDINMVYNSIEQAWKPSFNENIKKYDDDGIERYIWTDADGTKHWFTPYMEKNYWGQYLYYNVSADGTKTQTTTPTEFYPEDDIDYVLTKTTNNELILKDYQGNQKLFDGSGRLSKICDAQGNVLHFSYTNGIITCIDFVSSDNIQTPQVEFTYDSINKLLTVHNFVTELETSLTWNDSGLSKIVYNDIDDTKDNTVDIYYVADSHKVEKISDALESKYVKYTVNANERISAIQAYNNSNVLQLQYNITYNSDNTVCTNLGTDLSSNTDNTSEKYTFDRRGRKITRSESNGNSNIFTLIDSWTHIDEILPDDIYYTISYSSNINNNLTVSGNENSLVRYDISTGQETFLSLSDVFATNVDINSISNATENSCEEERSLYNINTIMPRDVIGDDTRTPVTDTTVYPYNSICYIEITYYNVWNNVEQIYEPRTFRGSGFLVGPNLVLTAGHNLYSDVTEPDSDYNDDIYNPRFAEEIVVYPGACWIENNSPDLPFGYFEVDASYIQKQYYDSPTFDYDWGLCVLKGEVGNQIECLDIAITPNDIINDEINVVGYPGDKRIVVMHEATGEVVSVDSYSFYYNADTFSGSSGSPVFANDEDFIVIGIHVSGFDEEDDNYANDFNGATKINIFIYTIAMIL